jgi:hypothetical protein
VARRAGARAPRGEPQELAPCESPSSSTPRRVGTLLEFLGFLAFNGLAHAEGRGALVGRLGTRWRARPINLADSPRFPRTLPRAFDAEGVPKAPLPLIQDGVAHAVVHDTRSAAAPAAARARRATRSPRAARPGARFRRTSSSAAAARATRPSSIAPIERGLYVTRLWYVNPVHEQSTLLTGMTRDGTYLIEDGRIGRPVRDVRFTDSILHLLDGPRRSRPRSGSSRGRVLRPALRDGDRLPRAARERLPDHGQTTADRLPGLLQQQDRVDRERDREPIVQRLRLRSTSEPPPSGPWPVPTPNAPESPRPSPSA